MHQIFAMGESGWLYTLDVAMGFISRVNPYGMIEETFEFSADYSSDSLGGIDCYSYAEDCATSCAHEVADQMESDGYVILNRPARCDGYNKLSYYKDKFKRQLDGSLGR